MPAWTISGPSPFSNGSWSFGDIFTVGSNSITVDGLGAFDANLDGFVTSGGIQVGLFRESDNALLASTSVQSGDTLIGNYRFDSISPLTLLANTQYRVVAVSENDLYNITAGTPTTVDPRITWNSYGYCSTTSLTSCNTHTGTERTWMANFLIDSEIFNGDVPAPGMLGLFGCGLVALGLARRRRG